MADDPTKSSDATRVHAEPIVRSPPKLPWPFSNMWDSRPIPTPEPGRDAIKQSERSSENATVPEKSPKPDFWTYADKAMFGLCELLALLFGLPFGDDLYHDKPIASIGGWHWFYFGTAALFAVTGPMWPWIRTRTWLPAGVAASLSKAPLDARLWIAALLFLFLYGTAPEIYQRATAPAAPPAGFTQQQVDEKIAVVTAPIQSKLDAARQTITDLKNAPPRSSIIIHDPPTAADIAKATAPIQAQLNAVTQQRDAAMSDAAALRHQLEAAQRGSQNTSVPPSSSAKPEDVATQIEVWQTIDDKMNVLAETINQGHAVLDSWAARLKSDRASVIPAIEKFNKSLSAVKNALQTLRHSYPDYVDIADALKETEYVRSPVPVTIFDKLLYSIQVFWNEVQSLSDPPPENYVDSMRAYTGAFRRDLAIVSAWQSTTRSLAKAKQRQLLNLEPK